MKTDRVILLVLPAVALVVAYWLLFLSPKREEASRLQEDVTALEAQVADAQQTADFAEQARDDFPRDYKTLVTLGKAVPEDDDTASLLAQLSGVSDRAGVVFRSLTLSESGSEEAPATAAPPEPPPAESAPAEDAPADVEPTSESVDAAATEATAANLPIGATVGPAGLPVMPYELEFQGDFFHVADFIGGLDSGVRADGKQVSVNGRLVTVDGFSLAQDASKGFPSLVANFAVTTYVTPSGQGLTAGATPTGPAPVAAPTPAGEVATEPTSSTEVAP